MFQAKHGTHIGRRVLSFGVLFLPHKNVFARKLIYMFAYLVLENLVSRWLAGHLMVGPSRRTSPKFR